MKSKDEVKTTTKTPRELAAEAQQALAEEAKARIEQCSTEVRAALDKYHCSIEGRAQITEDGKIVAFAAFVAQPLSE